MVFRLHRRVGSLRWIALFTLLYVAVAVIIFSRSDRLNRWERLIQTGPTDSPIGHHQVSDREGDMEVFPIAKGHVGGLSQADRQSKEGSPCTRILLMVLFNWPFFASIPFLRNLYAPGFHRHMRFFADGGPPRDDVISVSFGHGYAQHHALLQALNDFPDYDGYLMLGDDVMLHYKRLLAKLDPRKIWIMDVNPRERVFPISRSMNISRLGQPWTHPSGMPAMLEVEKNLTTAQRARMKRVFGCEPCAIKIVTDILYIPRTYVKEFMRLAYEWRSVMGEFAIPTIVYLLADIQDVEKIPGLTLWGKDRTVNVIERALDAWKMFVHPVKFSNPTLKKKAEEWLNKTPGSEDKAWATRVCRD